MRALIQRVREARVEVDQRIVGSIGPGMLVLLGIGAEDTAEDLRWIVDKITQLRIFDDSAGKMNHSILERTTHSILLISQFTLYGSVRKGNRPSYNRAAPAARAEALYLQCRDLLARQLQAAASRPPIATGIFGADMTIFPQLDGPVSLWLDSRNIDG